MPGYDAIKAGRAAVHSLDRDAPALVLYGYAFGARKGDIFEISIDGPDGRVIAHSVALEKNQAQLFRAAGKRRPGAGWPAGQYEGQVRMLRGHEEIDRAQVTLTVE